MALGLKVPMQVEALVVNHSGGVWAGTTMNGGSVSFENQAALPTGVHLHWALPDGLTKGRAQAGSDQLVFPSVPDLWLVIRYEGAPTASQRTWKAWVVNSRTLGVQELTDRWLHPPVAAGRPRLTAVGFVNADNELLDDETLQPLPEGSTQWRGSWAAYLPDGGKRFSFHDSLEDNPSGALSYQVVGWYSSLGEDPLHGAGSVAARQDFVEAAEWLVENLGHSTVSAVDHALETPVRAGADRGVRIREEDLAVMGGLGLPTSPGAGDPTGPVVRPGGTVTRPGGTVVRPGGTVLGGGVLGGIRRPTDGRVVSGGTRLPGGIAGRLGAIATGLGTGRPVGGTGVRVPEGTVRVVDVVPDLSGLILGSARAAAAAEGRVAAVKDAVVDEAVAAANRVFTTEGPLATTLAPHLGAAEAFAGGFEAWDWDIRRDFLRELNEVSSSYPDRIYCHGQVVDVEVGGFGGTYKVERMPTTGLNVTVGENLYDATTNMLGASDTPSWLLSALHAGRIAELGSLEDLPRVVQLLHQESFVSSDGGVLRTLNLPYEVAPRFGGVTSGATSPSVGSAVRPTASALKDAGVDGTFVAFLEDAARQPAVARKVDAIVERVASMSGADGASSSVLSAREREVFADWGHVGIKVSGSIAGVDRVLDVVLDGLHTVDPSIVDLSGRRVVNVPAPRFWRPKQPTLMIEGPGRSLRYGHDGRFEEDGKLVCRATSQRVRSLSTKLPGSVTGRAAGEDVLASRSSLTRRLPQTVRELLEEGALLDPACVPVAVDTVTNPSRKGTRSYNASESAAIHTGFQTETVYWWLSGTQDANVRAEILAHSGYEGVLPSRLAITPWRTPWDPVFLEFELELWHDARAVSEGWTLGEVAYEPKGALQLEKIATYKGRSYPSDAAAITLSSALQRLHDQLSESVGDASVLDALQGAMIGAANQDLVSCSLQGLDAAFRDAGSSLRAGAVAVKQLRVVDGFGRVLSVLPTGNLALPADEQVALPDGGTGFLLTPRIPARSRLMFRLRSAADDTVDAGQISATEVVSPVCGYLMVDHVEHALEVFDGDGHSLGQLRHANVRDTPRVVVWEAGPGQEPGWGAGPAAVVENAHLLGIIEGVLDASRYEMEQVAQGLLAADGESPLSALIRVVDTAQYTVDRIGESAEYLSTLVSRPVAVVRATAAIEVHEDDSLAPLPDGLEVRLGAIKQGDDGLLAYFVDDDYALLRPPHPVVRSQALLSGPTALASANHGRVAVVSDYVSVDATVTLDGGRQRALTLLVDPGAGVHAACGVLPRKRISLQRELVDEALQRMAPTFRVGPVLMDPSKAMLPVLGAERFTWEWTRREAPAGTPSNWSVGEVRPATEAAMVPQSPAKLQEGWLRLAVAAPE